MPGAPRASKQAVWSFTAGTVSLRVSRMVPQKAR